jgi:hypothetical protein
MVGATLAVAQGRRKAGPYSSNPPIPSAFALDGRQQDVDVERMPVICHAWNISDKSTPPLGGE